MSTVETSGGGGEVTRGAQGAGVPCAPREVRAPRVHELKCWPDPFQAILDGRKRFEFRRDDRGYAVGDILDLHEWDPHTRYYRRVEVDGISVYRAHRVLVTYILRGQHGVPDDFVVMSIEPETTT